MIALSAFQLAGAAAFAATSSQLDAALTICTSLPQPSGVVADKLVGTGWAADSDAVMAAFVSGAFAFYLKPHDIAYSLDNGWFMAVSVLGNSALPPDQPGYSTDTLRLAVLAGESAQGYCVLSGDDGLLTDLQSAAALTEYASDDLQSRFKGSLSGHSIEVVWLKRIELQRLIAQATPQYVDPTSFVFDDVNVYISPAKQEDQK